MSSPGPVRWEDAEGVEILMPDGGMLVMPAPGSRAATTAACTAACPQCPDLNQGCASMPGPDGRWLTVRYAECGHLMVFDLDRGGRVIFGVE